jgi:hypothetical protein
MLGLPAASLNTASLCEARARLHVGVLKGAALSLARDLSSNVTREDFWAGMTPCVIDGTTLTANDTALNQVVYPQPASQAAGAGFPSLRVVVLQCLTSGTVLNLAFGPVKGKGTGEMALAREVMPDLPDNALLIGDRYFPSYFTLSNLTGRKAHGLFQAHASRIVDFREGKWNGNKDRTMTWEKPPRPEWMDEVEYKGYPSTMSVRTIEIRTKKSDGEPIVIVTTLLDEKRFPKNINARMYRKRWNIEVMLRDVKGTFNLDHINANCPEMIEKVIWSHTLAYNILRWHMTNASLVYNVPLENISVQATATVVTANRVAILTMKRAALPALFAEIYFQVVQPVVGKRLDREEPRAVKRRPKPRALLKEPRSAWQERRSA